MCRFIDCLWDFYLGLSLYFRVLMLAVEASVVSESACRLDWILCWGFCVHVEQFLGDGYLVGMARIPY